MTGDVTCPACGQEQEINHDDGYGYAEDQGYEQTCDTCDTTFKYTTSISFSYDVYCGDDQHKLEQCPAPHELLWECKKCDYYEIRRK